MVSGDVGLVESDSLGGQLEQLFLILIRNRTLVHGVVGRVRGGVARLGGTARKMTVVRTRKMWLHHLACSVGIYVFVWTICIFSLMFTIHRNHNVFYVGQHSSVKLIKYSHRKWELFGLPIHIWSLKHSRKVFDKTIVFIRIPVPVLTFGKISKPTHELEGQKYLTSDGYFSKDSLLNLTVSYLDNNNETAPYNIEGIALMSWFESRLWAKMHRLAYKHKMLVFFYVNIQNK